MPRDERGDLDITALINGATPAVVYACGPERLLNAVATRCDEVGLPMHSERFSAPDTDTAPSPAEHLGDGAAFVVELARSGGTVEVTAGESILDAVKGKVPGVPSSCREGYCGTCETRVLDGIPDHRDTVLTDEEQAANEVMMICVGRSKTPRLVLDL